MKDKVATILRIFLTVLLAISAVLFVIFYSNGEGFTSVVLSWAYILLVITTLVTIIFPIVYIISNPKSGKTVLVGLAGFAVLFVIAYSIASGSIQGEVYETFNISEATSRFIGGMLNLTYILALVAVLSIVYSGISSFFK